MSLEERLEEFKSASETQDRIEGVYRQIDNIDDEDAKQEAQRALGELLDEITDESVNMDDLDFSRWWNLEVAIDRESLTDLGTRKQAYENFREAIDRINDITTEEENAIIDLLGSIKEEISGLKAEIESQWWESAWIAVNKEHLETWNFNSEKTSFIDNPVKHIENMLTWFLSSMISSINWLASFSLLGKQVELMPNKFDNKKISKFFEKIDYISEDDKEWFTHIFDQIEDKKAFGDEWFLNKIDTETWEIDINSLSADIDISSYPNAQEHLNKLWDFARQNNEFIFANFPEDEREDVKMKDVFSRLFNNPVSNMVNDYATPSKWVKIPDSWK